MTRGGQVDDLHESIRVLTCCVSPLLFFFTSHLRPGADAAGIERVYSAGFFAGVRGKRLAPLTLAGETFTCPIYRERSTLIRPSIRFSAHPGDVQLPATEHRPTVGRDRFPAVRRRRGADLHVRPGDGRPDHHPHVRRLDDRQRPHRRPGALLLEQRLERRREEGVESQEDQVDIRMQTRPETFFFHPTRSNTLALESIELRLIEN